MLHWIVQAVLYTRQREPSRSRAVSMETVINDYPLQLSPELILPGFSRLEIPSALNPHLKVARVKVELVHTCVQSALSDKTVRSEPEMKTAPQPQGPEVVVLEHVVEHELLQVDGTSK